MKFAAAFAVLFFFQPAFARDITLAWDPPRVAPGLAGYMLASGYAPGQYETEWDVGNVTECTVLGLDPGFTYYFAVRAYGTAGERSAYSNEVVVKIPRVKGEILNRDYSKKAKPATNSTKQPS